MKSQPKANLPNTEDIGKDLLADQQWRLNNLYYIIDKEGRRVRFRLNWAQEELFDNLWYCNIILKARQLGMSTFILLYMLDNCLFIPDLRCGVIAHNLEDAEYLFRDKVKFAYDNLPEALRKWRSLDTPGKTATKKELMLNNNSSIRVGTSMRSGTLNFLHISEFGKICRKYPEKAREIVAGSLNTVQAGQHIFIESTAEGRE